MLSTLNDRGKQSFSCRTRWSDCKFPVESTVFDKTISVRRSNRRSNICAGQWRSLVGCRFSNVFRSSEEFDRRIRRKVSDENVRCSVANTRSTGSNKFSSSCETKCEWNRDVSSSIDAKNNESDRWSWSTNKVSRRDKYFRFVQWPIRWEQSSLLFLRREESLSDKNLQFEWKNIDRRSGKSSVVSIGICRRTTNNSTISDKAHKNSPFDRNWFRSSLRSRWKCSPGKRRTRTNFCLFASDRCSTQSDRSSFRRRDRQSFRSNDNRSTNSAECRSAARQCRRFYRFDRTFALNRSIWTMDNLMKLRHKLMNTDSNTIDKPFPFDMLDMMSRTNSWTKRIHLS